MRYMHWNCHTMVIKLVKMYFDSTRYLFLLERVYLHATTAKAMLYAFNRVFDSKSS